MPKHPSEQTPPRLFLFDEDSDSGDLVLHFPDHPGTMMAMCGRTFTEDHLYLPDGDQAIADFCPVCQEGWIEYKTANKHGWKNKKR